MKAFLVNLLHVSLYTSSYQLLLLLLQRLSMYVYVSKACWLKGQQVKWDFYVNIYVCVCVLASQHVQQFCFYATCVPVVYVPHFICCTFVFRRYMYVIDMFFLLLLTYKQSANKLSHRFLANGASLSTCGNIYWWVFVFCFQLLFMNSILYVYILLDMYAFSRFMCLALGCYA